MALLMSLVLGTGFALSGNSVSAQSYQMNDKQSYDDSSYSSDIYSKYPTNDKPYVCQKGPFEGFYVSSVQFCKFGFDDRKDNQYGNDDDKKERSNFNTYTVTSEEDTGSSGTLEARAECKDGDPITGGGFEYSSSTTTRANGVVPVADADITISKPFPLDEDNTAGFATQTEGWEAQLDIESLLNTLQATPPTPPEFTLVAYAVCADNSKHDNNHDYSDDNRHDYSEDDYNNRM